MSLRGGGRLPEGSLDTFQDFLDFFSAVKFDGSVSISVSLGLFCFAFNRRVMFLDICRNFTSCGMRWPLGAMQSLWLSCCWRGWCNWKHFHWTNVSLKVEKGDIDGYMHRINYLLHLSNSGNSQTIYTHTVTQHTLSYTSSHSPNSRGLHMHCLSSRLPTFSRVVMTSFSATPAEIATVLANRNVSAEWQNTTMRLDSHWWSLDAFISNRLISAGGCDLGTCEYVVIVFMASSDLGNPLVSLAVGLHSW